MFVFLSKHSASGDSHTAAQCCDENGNEPASQPTRKKSESESENNEHNVRLSVCSVPSLAAGLVAYRAIASPERAQLRPLCIGNNWRSQ